MYQETIACSTSSKRKRIAAALDGATAFLRQLYKVSESEPEHERIRSSRKPLRLSEREYRYIELKSGIEEEPIPDEWGYRPHELENQLDSTMERLPVRLRLLADDIRVLDRYGRFQSSRWSNHLAELGFKASQLSVAPYGYHREEPNQYNFGSIGEMFGQIVQNLTSDIHDTNGDKIDIILGFIEGLSFAHNTDASGRTRESAFPDLLNILEARSEEFIKQISSGEREANQWYMEQNAEREQDIKYICDVLQEYNIASERTTRKAMASSIKPGLMPPRESEQRGEFEVYKDTTAKQIIDMVIKKRLVEDHQLSRILFEDWRRLKEKSGRGVAPKDIPQYLNSEGPSSSREIADHFTEEKGSNRDWTAGVTESSRDLAGQRSASEHPERAIWSEHPLLEGDADCWSLTNYGKAFATYRNAHNDKLIFSLDMLSTETSKAVIREFDLPHGIYAKTE